MCKPHKISQPKQLTAKYSLVAKILKHDFLPNFRNLFYLLGILIFECILIEFRSYEVFEFVM